jgi:hypothetical protein
VPVAVVVLAIAMVRREVEPGGEVTVRDGSGDTRATISLLSGALTA